MLERNHCSQTQTFYLKNILLISNNTILLRNSEITPPWINSIPQNSHEKQKDKIFVIKWLEVGFHQWKLYFQNFEESKRISFHKILSNLPFSVNRDSHTLDLLEASTAFKRSKVLFCLLEVFRFLDFFWGEGNISCLRKLRLNSHEQVPLFTSWKELCR